MFCSKCGSPIPDGYKFCSKCGSPVAANVAPQAPVRQPSEVTEAPVYEAPVYEAPVQPVPQAPQYNQPQYQSQPQYQYQFNQPRQPKKPVNKKLIGIIAGAAAVVIIALVLILTLGGGKGGANGYKDAAVGYCNSMYKDYSIKKMISYMPDAVVEAELEANDMTRKEFIEEYQYYLDLLKESINDEYGKNWSVSSKFSDSEKLDKDDLEDLNDELKEEYGKKIGKVTEAYEVEIEITLSYKEDGEKQKDTETEIVTVGKINGKWYVIDADLF